MPAGIQITFIIFSILAGGVGILFSYQMLRKYPIPYLSTYLYYLIFLFIFGIYGILLPGILDFVLGARMEVEALESIKLFIAFFGIPFLILSLYMFLRLSRELVNKTLKVWFNLVYFFLMSMFFFAYGYFLVRVYGFGETRFDMIWMLIKTCFSIVTALIVAGSIFQLFYLVPGVLDTKERHITRTFGLTYLAFYILALSLLNLSHLNQLVAIGFVFFFFSLHLLPVLFLYINMETITMESSGVNGLENNIEIFVEKFGISRRETEIIQLICKGKSNQDISDSLYISLQTVKDHIHRIFLKTGVKNRVQLTNLIRTSS
ncbi:MAG: helix-turn-helix transcriptional regulator [Deltaproteobacteria bacterium]|nr:helix-turn-helix transcriptional regulator [Deltaproteobacteria bacterium]